MPNVTIDVWQFVEADAFLYYKFAGTIDGKPWCAKVGIEIDGRDAEYERLWGETVNCADNPDAWGAFLAAMDDAEGLYADMEKHTTAYYEQCAS